MLFFRLLGKIFLVLAFVAIAYDGARILATPGQGLLLTSISKHLKTRFPGAEEAFQQWILARAPEYIWTGVVEPLLVLPVSLLCAGLGTLLFLAGYRRPPPEILND